MRGLRLKGQVSGTGEPPAGSRQGKELVRWLRSGQPDPRDGWGTQEGQGRPGFPTVLDALFLPAPGGGPL